MPPDSPFWGQPATLPDKILDQRLTSTTLEVYLIDLKTFARPYCVKEAVMKFPQGSLERSMVEFICIFGTAEMLLFKGALKHIFLHLNRTQIRKHKKIKRIKKEINH